MESVEKKKKAFTLIELLAVIVILAIIALIATPIIGKLVDRARKEAFKESAVGVIRASENYMGKYILKNHADPSFPIVFVCNGVVCTDGDETLDIAGKVPKSGSIILENHKSIKAEYLSDGKYCVAGVKSNLQVANSCADIDVTRPTISVEAEGAILKITMTDNESGIASYCVTNEDTTSNCSWIDTTDTYKEHKVEESDTYYVFAKDGKGNVSISASVYADVINAARQILDANPTILTNPTLTTTSASARENGLYSLDVVNGYSNGTDGTTYYFRGNVDNNYVSFAGKIWRIVRINEDETIRLILNEISDIIETFPSNGYSAGYSQSYYSTGSRVVSVLNEWYDENIGNNEEYSSKIAEGQYFCEAAEVINASGLTAGDAQLTVYSEYTPNFTCETDGNGHGVIDNTYKIGLLTYDEAVRAGAYFNAENKTYYLYRNGAWWTMSPGGSYNNYARIWYMKNNGALDYGVNLRSYLRPVINLKASVVFTGTGTSADPYVVE